MSNEKIRASDIFKYKEIYLQNTDRKLLHKKVFKITQVRFKYGEINLNKYELDIVV